MNTFLFKRLKEQITNGEIQTLDQLIEVLVLFEIDFKHSGTPTVKRVSSKTLESIESVKLTGGEESDII